MAFYDISTIGTAANKIFFNDDSQNPYFRMTARYITQREMREFNLAIPEADGITDYNTFTGKEYFLIEGILIPSDDAAYYTGLRALRKLGSLAVSQKDAASDGGYVPYQWNEEVGKQIMMKVLHVNLKETFKQGIVLPFRLLCKIKWPYMTAQTSKTVLLNVTTSGAGGGAAYPVKFPVGYGTSTSTSSGTAYNAGDAPAFPTITLIGPLTLPRITNSTTGEYLELNLTLPTSADSAIISYDADSLTVTANGSNVYGNLTAGSKLFTIRPGNNALTLTGTSVGVGASAAINFSDTYPIS